MRILLCALAAILVLGGAGAGAYYYFSGNSAQAADGAEVGDQHDAHKQTAKKAKGGHDAAPSFVELDPLILPIVDNNGVSQIVTMVISLEVHDAAAAETVSSLSPRLKDAFIQDMYGVLNRHAALKGGVIQVSKIKERLSVLSGKVVGENMISDVLLQVVQQRPI